MSRDAPIPVHVPIGASYFHALWPTPLGSAQHGISLCTSRRGQITSIWNVPQYRNRYQRISNYVSASENPADHGSCSIPASKLYTNIWLKGPNFLHGNLSWAQKEQVSNVSCDPENPYNLTPSMLLTQKTGTHTSPLSDINAGNMLKCQWKRFQVLPAMS